MQTGGTFFGRIPCRFGSVLSSHVSVHYLERDMIAMRFDAVDVQPPQPYTFSVIEAEQLRDALDEAIMTAVQRER